MKWKKIIIKDYPIEKRIKKLQELGISLRKIAREGKTHIALISKAINRKRIMSEKIMGDIVRGVEILENKAKKL